MPICCGVRCAFHVLIEAIVINCEAGFYLQEEPLNNGAWTYVGPRIQTAASQTTHHQGKFPKYAGRGPTSSVATGSKVRVAHSPGGCGGYKRLLWADSFSLVCDQMTHKKEIAKFLDEAFTL